jgi:hypothetical protein
MMKSPTRISFEYRNQSTSFTGLAAEDMLQVAIDTQDQNDVIWGQAVSGNYFDVMQVKPLMGRAFLPEEDGAPGHIQLLYWGTAYGNDASVQTRTSLVRSCG